jgi:hypothetical protein
VKWILIKTGRSGGQTMKWDGKRSLALAMVAVLFSATGPPTAKAQEIGQFSINRGNGGVKHAVF